MLLKRLKSLFFPCSKRKLRVRMNLRTADVLETRQLLSAVTIQLAASKDNTIYQADADVSNGQGEFVLAGGGTRGLIQFDVNAGTIPSGSTIIDAVLTLNLGLDGGGQSAVSVHRVSSSWGEAGSNASGDESQGAVAQQFDATWLYSSFDGQLWNSPGGDFAGASATTVVGGVGTYEWLGGGLIDDVQAWVDGVSSNFGWLVQAGGGALKSFISKDGPDVSLAPTLEITFEEPPVPHGVVEGRIWNDLNADGKPLDNPVSDLGLSVFRSTYFNAFGGQEYWYRSASSNAWYFLTPDGTLTRWSGAGGTLSGEVVTTLDQRFYYDPSLIVRSVTESEPWLDGREVELVDSQGSVYATTVTSGRDIDGNGVIDALTEGGWYRFEDVPSDQVFTVRQILPTGWVESATVDIDISNGTEQLVNGLELRMRGSFYEGDGGLGEKWVFSERKGWHFITPDGNLYRWDGKPISKAAPLKGTLVATIGTMYFSDPTKLFNGQFRTDGLSEGDLLFRVDFGARETFAVSGRVWMDFYANGIREEMTYVPEYVPDTELGVGEEWFFDEPNDVWYIINADGEFQYWGPSPTSGSNGSGGGAGGVGTGNSTGSGPGGDPEGGATATAIYQVEPWLNNRTVELIDSTGRVVATTVSYSIDLNGDGEIQNESERGHYTFRDVEPGEYTVRTLTDQVWSQTSPVSSSQSIAIGLDAQYSFRSTNSSFTNWGGKNERWIIDGLGRWYYMLPDGSLYEWQVGTGSQGVELGGTLIASLSSEYYDDLRLLTDPDTAAATVIVSANSVVKQVVFGNHKLFSDVPAS